MGFDISHIRGGGRVGAPVPGGGRTAKEEVIKETKDLLTRGLVGRSLG